MKQLNQYIPFNETGYCSSLVSDFLTSAPSIRNFTQYNPTHPDVELAIKTKANQPIHRDVLVKALQGQYSRLEHVDTAVRTNIELLLSTNTYTICTAHQPNIFTGYLYFVYKILQTVKLSRELTEKFPGKHFVPVYYMGSEDADLDELGKIFLNNKTISWPTQQHGAVGRMKTEGFAALIDQVTAELGYGPFAADLVEMLKKAYLGHDTIQEATLYLVNELFGKYGVVVLIPDNPALKRLYIPVMQEELLQQSSFHVVEKTNVELSKNYKAQAYPREINLFYLSQGTRERIVKEGEVWKVLNTPLEFDEATLLQTLHDYPERFSPNVILRGMFQETILPNVAFIGGGGEVAYWLQLKDLFNHYNVPYPIVLLRNSFLYIDQFHHERIAKLGLSVQDLFIETEALVNAFVRKHTNAELVLKEEYALIDQLFAKIAEKAKQIDVTLEVTTQVEHNRAIKSIGKLEHKFLKAEKKKFAWQTEQIRQLKARLFPGNSLQERKENFMPYYAMYGEAFFETILNAMIPVTDQFCVIAEA
ncbi:bacillithiol biosynthesis cysteine-adding enzyme BshC [Chitinophaga skermanii]|uniref:Putative cysteine ligase BshC n=1 Tax=Chitinophaga skermanii TaxID=331697 RepID=A0A327QVK5_9BACT|nr:bacillithiol biosynthesis cysteine-adding enzyme BshC [Chitinophaga skermanii]RAJ08410.1 bacillithiol biosynthesis cysteine-adding enzyme BshC [Chitinophaga skermanii]